MTAMPMPVAVETSASLTPPMTAVAEERRYREPLADDWRDLLAAHTGLRPIVLQVARGEALTDAETGAHDEVGLRYHALAIIGSRDDAYLAVDGDNPEVTRRFQVYSPATIAAALPCGLLILEMQREGKKGHEGHEIV